MCAKQAGHRWRSTPKGTMRERAIAALQRTWQAIGYDTLQAVADTTRPRRTAEQVSMPRAEVIDAVSSCGFANGYPDSYGQDPEAVQWLEDQDWDEQDAICQAAFPHATYGL